MAGDWIKLRKDLPTDPAVIRMADILGLDIYGVVGRLASVWAWADTHSDCHGHVTLVSRSCLDSVAECAGFGAAMEAVGWLASGVDGASGITFPRFDRHMGQGAKARAMSTQRKKLQRLRSDFAAETKPKIDTKKRHGDVTVMSRNERDKSVTREEKRREEKKNGTSYRAAASPTAPREPPDSPHHRAIAYFCDRWRERYGEKYAFNAGKDAKAVQWMLSQVGGDEEKFRTVCGRYLADDEDFVTQNRHTIGLLRSQFPQWLVERPPRKPRSDARTEYAIDTALHAFGLSQEGDG